MNLLSLLPLFENYRSSKMKRLFVIILSELLEFHAVSSLSTEPRFHDDEGVMKGREGERDEQVKFDISDKMITRSFLF